MNKFITYCETGELEKAKELYGLGGIDIHAEDDYAFRSSYENGHIKTAEWLYALGGVDIDKDDYVLLFL